MRASFLTNHISVLFIAAIFLTLLALAMATFWLNPPSPLLILIASVALVIELFLWMQRGDRQKHLRQNKASGLNPSQIEKYDEKLRKISE